MGANANDFLKFRMDEDDYKLLSNETRSRMDLISKDVQDFDYTSDELWQELKKKSYKAYKELKKREYEIRFNK